MIGDDLYRPEIRAFILDCETLLSPILLQPPLTHEETKVVEFYLEKLLKHCQSVKGSMSQN